jgi:hypothetical protein
MKKIKILTLFVLLMGFLTATAQQAAPVSQKSDVVPATEQLNKTELDASQPPAMSPETISPVSSTVPSTEMDMSKADPAERDASIPPVESEMGSGQDETMQPLENEQSGYQGPTAADPPEENIPIK